MKRMKCKRCGHRTNTINAMRIHYWKKHPQAMKRHHKKEMSAHDEKSYHKYKKRVEGYDYCPHCGKAL